MNNVTQYIYLISPPSGQIYRRFHVAEADRRRYNAFMSPLPPGGHIICKQASAPATYHYQQKNIVTAGAGVALPQESRQAIAGGKFTAGVSMAFRFNNTPPHSGDTMSPATTPT